MSGHDRPAAFGWLRGALIVLVVAALLGAFSLNGGFDRPELGAVNIAGIAVMLVGLAVVLFSRKVAAIVLKSEAAVAYVKLAGVLVCGVGAALVFL